jgi:hypothetical protein
MFAENADIFETLAWKIFDSIGKNEFLVYTQMRSDHIYRRPFNWVTAKMPYSIYCLLPPEKDPPDFLSPYNEVPCEMEPFFA